MGRHRRLSEIPDTKYAIKSDRSTSGWWWARPPYGSFRRFDSWDEAAAYLVRVHDDRKQTMPKDPRDTVGKNPTGNPRKSSAGSRRKAERKMDRDLKGTPYETKKET